MKFENLYSVLLKKINNNDQVIEIIDEILADVNLQQLGLVYRIDRQATTYANQSGDFLLLVIARQR